MAFCYLIKSLSIPTKTYFGCTNDTTRRLRQHNGEVVGGARKTAKARPWTYVCIISGFNTRNDALKFEYAMNRKRRYSINGRIKSIAEVISMEKWTSTSPLARNVPLEVHWFESRKLPYKPTYCTEHGVYYKIDDPTSYVLY